MGATCALLATLLCACGDDTTGGDGGSGGGTTATTTGTTTGTTTTTTATTTTDGSWSMVASSAGDTSRPEEAAITARAESIVDIRQEHPRSLVECQQGTRAS